MPNRPKNNFIYGSLAFIPFVLLIIYLIWLIILYGAAVGYIYQRLYHLRDKDLAFKSIDYKAFHELEIQIFQVLKTIHELSGSLELHGRKIVTSQKIGERLGLSPNNAESLAAPLVDLELVTKRKINSGFVYIPKIPLAEVDLIVLHRLLQKLDPKAVGELRTQSALDELNHTLGLLYSTGKGIPPFTLGMVWKMEQRENSK